MQNWTRSLRFRICYTCWFRVWRSSWDGHGMNRLNGELGLTKDGWCYSLVYVVFTRLWKKHAESWEEVHQLLFPGKAKATVSVAPCFARRKRKAKGLGEGGFYNCSLSFFFAIVWWAITLKRRKARLLRTSRHFASKLLSLCGNSFENRYRLSHAFLLRGRWPLWYGCSKKWNTRFARSNTQYVRLSSVIINRLLVNIPAPHLTTARPLYA